MAELNLNTLVDFIKKIPAINSSIGSGIYESKNWWIKFSIDIENNLAWNVVQELGHIVNYLSVEERLPAIFYPVSSPPYLNGGPHDFLYWVIESTQNDFTPQKLKEWLEGRLPNPVENIEGWKMVE
jgi:hypothetical protein